MEEAGIKKWSYPLLVTGKDHVFTCFSNKSDLKCWLERFPFVQGPHWSAVVRSCSVLSLKPSSAHQDHILSELFVVHPEGAEPGSASVQVLGGKEPRCWECTNSSGEWVRSRCQGQGGRVRAKSGGNWSVRQAGEEEVEVAEKQGCSLCPVLSTLFWHPSYASEFLHHQL